MPPQFPQAMRGRAGGSTRQTAISGHVRRTTLPIEGPIEMKCGAKNRKAFTLAEAMIAMVILA
ncbi:MAG: hypothetical protein DRP00_06135, partial [Candidatus Aenigmatarchaeota archaeon]